jgi:hypothetical protein
MRAGQGIKPIKTGCVILQRDEGKYEAAYQLKTHEAITHEQLFKVLRSIRWYGCLTIS